MKPEEVDHRSPDWDELGNLLGAYLHQDAGDEFGDSWAAVRAYISDNSSSSIARARRQGARLLEIFRTDEEAERAMVKLGLDYYIPADGRTYRDWLIELVDALRRVE
jgi:CdiI immunity protein